jgi:TatD DNase family protein
MMLIDTHCHLDFPDFDTDRAEVVARARAAGVNQFIAIATQTATADRVIAAATPFTEAFWSVGVHPCHVNEGLFSVEDLRTRAAHPRCVGLGETGLDYYHPSSDSDKSLQRQSFHNHMQAAQHTSLPVIIHSRNAEADTLALLQEMLNIAPFTFVIHCFTGTKAFAQEILAMGGYISIPGIVTFKNAKDVQDVAASIPLERMVIETDAPYLAPVPHRGQRNEIAFVADTARAVATLRSISIHELARATTANARRLFTKLAA